MVVAWIQRPICSIASSALSPLGTEELSDRQHVEADSKPLTDGEYRAPARPSRRDKTASVRQLICAGVIFAASNIGNTSIQRRSVTKLDCANYCTSSTRFLLSLQCAKIPLLRPRLRPGVYQVLSRKKVLWTRKGVRATAVTAGHCTHA